VSYDLLIIPKAYDANAIREHFASRRCYEVSESQAGYGNDDTGVYFTFGFEDDRDASEDEQRIGSHIAFNINFYRPHIFALEAEPEIAAFLARFESAIVDPQNEGMGSGPYSRDGFVRGWNAGNRVAFKVMAEHGKSAPPWPADPALIEAIWKWNYGRKDLQKLAGEDVFVPRISWFQPEDGAAPVPACTWTEHVPTMIPENLVSHVALVRQPRRRSLLQSIGLAKPPVKPEFEIKLVGVKGVVHLVGMDRGDAHGNSVVYTPFEGPPATREVFSGDWPEPEIRMVAAEHVCGADLIALTEKS